MRSDKAHREECMLSDKVNKKETMLSDKHSEETVLCDKLTSNRRPSEHYLNFTGDFLNIVKTLLEAF
jgi:hypothetical protein